MGLEYIGLAPGFAKEVLEIYESWEGKEAVPMKFKELMLVLRIEVARRYKPYVPPGKTKDQDTQGHQTRLRTIPRKLSTASFTGRRY